MCSGGGLAGRSLHGKDAQRFAELAQRVAEEQQLFLKAMWAGAQDASERYRHMDPRVDSQLQVIDRDISH